MPRLLNLFFAGLLFFGSLLFQSYSLAAQNFYLAPNGVTCLCPDAAIGETGDPGDGVTYTKP